MKPQQILRISALFTTCVALTACSAAVPGEPRGDDGNSGGSGGAAAGAGGGGAGTAGFGVGGSSAGLGGTGIAGFGTGGSAGFGGVGGSAGFGGTGIAGFGTGGSAGFGGVGGTASGGTATSGGSAGAFGGAAGSAGAAGPGSGGTGSGGTGSGGTGSGGTGSGGSGNPGGTFVEDDGTSCQVPDPPSANTLPSISLLPDPFEKLDGNRISTKAEWRCRRAEIKKHADWYVYGYKPPKPSSVSGTVSNTSITVNVSHQGQSTSFSVSVQLPSSGSGPYPAIIGLASGFLPFPLDGNLVRGEGVATINFDPYEVGAETGASRSNKQGAFYDIYGSNSTTGLLAAWAWGVSRIIDVIEQSGGSILKADAIGVTGCSRFGKGAFTIGAYDQRIALTLPIESGSGGVPIWRGLSGEGAQSASSAYGETYWLGDAFGSFLSSITTLPIDTHSIVAMIAPRGLFIMDNPHIANLGPRSAHVAALAGAEVYKALGAGDAISYHSAVADGGHCAQRSEWTEPLRRNIRRFLRKTANDPGAITAAGNTTGNLSQWRDWTTPTLD